MPKQSDLDLILEAWPDKDEPVVKEVKAETKEEPAEVAKEEPTVKTEEGKEVEEPVDKKVSEDLEKKADTEDEVKKEEPVKEEVKKEEPEKPETFVPEGELYDLVKEEGKEFKTIEEYNSHVTETVKNLKQQASEFAAVSQKLGEMTQANPEFAILVKSLGEGKDFLEAIIDAGIPSLLPEDGDFDHEDFKKKIADRKEANKVTLRTQEELKANIAKSIVSLDKFTKDNNLGEDYKKAVYKTATEFSNGNVSNEIMTLIQDGLKFKTEVKRLTELAAKEREAGLVQGRNEKIVKDKQLKANDVNIPDVDSKSRAKEKANIFTDEEKLMVEINNRNTHFKR